MNPLGFFFAAAGLFAIVAALMDWDWFMNSSKARFMCTICGRTGARVFYILLGAGLTVLGGLLALGVIHNSR